MLELKQLRYFVAVAQAEHVGRAADRLAISQPPLSRQMQDLEARLGLQLFDRTGRRLKLTAAGRDFLGEVQDLLAHAARVEQAARRAGTAAILRLTLGTVEGALQAGRVQADLRSFQARQPHTLAELRSLRSAAILDGLRRGELDLGYTHAAPPDDDPLLAHRLHHAEPFVLAVPSGHPLGRATRKTAPGPKQLQREPFIAMPAATHAIARAEWLSGCQAGGFTPEVRFEATDLATTLSLVAAGFGLALVQASAALQAPPGVSCLALPWLPLGLHIQLVWRRDATAAVAAYLVTASATAPTTASAKAASATRIATTPDVR